MSATDLSICQMAVGFLGMKKFQSLSDTANKSAVACNLVYESLRDEVQSAHFWNFNTRRETLAQLTNVPLFGAAYAYQVPTNVLHITMLKNPTVHYEREGDILYTDINPCMVKMLTRVTDTSKFSAGFVLTLAYRIAADLAYALTGSNTVADKMWDKYEKALKSAKGSDGIEGKLPPIVRHTLLESRLRGGGQLNWGAGFYVRGSRDV